MTKVQRREEELMRLLTASRKLELSEAMQFLQASESTVRRLFIRLEESGRAIRTHGGLQLAPTGAADYSYEQWETKNMEEKARIARMGAEMVEDGDILFLDSGTTLAQFSSALARRLERKELKQITVFTNSLVNLELLAKRVNVHLIGGQYRINRRDFCGYLAEEAVSGLHFSKCFLGCDGYSPSVGFTATDFSTARLSELALQGSDQRIILADAEKFRSASVVGYSKGQPVTHVVTDAPPDDEILRSLEERGARVHVA